VRELKNKLDPAVLVLVVSLIAAGMIYLAALTPRSFGFYHDDGIYVTTAKALATDQGYRIISLPSEPVQTKYPPFYPFLLSLIWRVNPDFPSNILPMMVLSVLATLASLALAWFYLTKFRYASRRQALLVVGLVAINWRTIVLGTGIYSEMLYTALSLAALYLAEKYEREWGHWLIACGLGIVMGLALLTRTAGITLLIAVAFYYVRRRQLRRALLPVAVGGCFVLGWAAWSYLNKSPTEGGVNAAYYTDYFRDLSQIVTDMQTQNNTSKIAVLLTIAGRNAYMLMVVSVPLVCLGLSYDWPQSLGGYSSLIALSLIFIAFVLTVVGFLRHRSGGLRLLHIYVISYLGLHLLWPYGVYDRFLMPLLPFLLLFLITELEWLVRLVRKELRAASPLANKISAGFLGLTLLGLIAAGLYGNGVGVYGSLGRSKRAMTSRATEEANAIDWINEHTDASDILVCYCDPLYYLYTGRKATRSFSEVGGNYWGHQIDQRERTKVILRIVAENNARYLICTTSDFELQAQPDLQRQGLKALLEENPRVFIPVFESGNGQSVIYRIEKDPS
jgi:Gpi18-like mannosyltransferase